MLILPCVLMLSVGIIYGAMAASGVAKDGVLIRDLYYVLLTVFICQVRGVAPLVLPCILILFSSYLYFYRYIYLPLDLPLILPLVLQLLLPFHLPFALTYIIVYAYLYPYIPLLSVHLSGWYNFTITHVGQNTRYFYPLYCPTIFRTPS